MEILQDYPGYQLYNDAVNLLKEVQNPTEEVKELMEEADKYWDRIDKSGCEPYVNHFAEKYTKFYKYHPIIMVNFILKKRTIDFDILKEYLRMREKRYKKELTKEKSEEIFGPVLFKKYVEPILTDERDFLKNQK
jgi:hypothetical protein